MSGDTPRVFGGDCLVHGCAGDFVRLGGVMARPYDIGAVVGYDIADALSATELR